MNPRDRAWREQADRANAHIFAARVRMQAISEARRLEAEALALVNQRCAEGEMLGQAIDGVTLVYYADGSGRRPRAMRVEDVEQERR